MDEEIWKPVVIEKNGVFYDFTGEYEVSNLGRVRSINYARRGYKKVLKTFTQQDGYLRDHLKHWTFYVHRIVPFAFLENPFPGLYTQVNHKDEDKQNNCADNLEWCDAAYNTNYGNAQKKKIESFKLNYYKN